VGKEIILGKTWRRGKGFEPQFTSKTFLKPLQTCIHPTIWVQIPAAPTHGLAAGNKSKPASEGIRTRTRFRLCENLNLVLEIAFYI